MLLIDGMGQKHKEKKMFYYYYYYYYYYCPLKSNRQVDDYSGGEKPYQRVDELEWSQEELERGKLIKIKGFPKNYKVKLFGVVVHSHRTEWIVTNDLYAGIRPTRRERCVA
jgi:hypothetical protein